MAKEKQSTEPTQPVPIAIIGIGCIFPKSHDLQEYWSNIKEGVDAITDIPATHWRPEDYFHQDPKHPDSTYAQRGGFVPPIDFNPLEFGILPNAIEATDTSQLLSLLAAQEALKDAGYLEREFNRDRTSVILGVTGALELVIPLGARLGHPIWKRALLEAGLDEASAKDIVERIGQGYVEWQENSFPGLLGNVVAGRIANRFDLGGTNCAVDAACASSLSAIHLATMELANHRADMVLTGGVDTFNHIFMYVCFSKTPALSPSGHARPFDHKSDGTTLGEGVGVVALKRLDDARRDGDKIYAVIKGIGSSSDGKGNSIYAPTPKGQTKAFRKTYELANVTPDTIELMEAHGTGTKVGDAIEIQSMLETYKAAQTNGNGAWCALGSVKSQIGHTKSAAGVAGLIKAAMALHYKTLPPTIKVEKPASELQHGQAPFYVNTEKRPWAASPTHPRRAAVSAFGFGGSNFHCVLEEDVSQKPEVDWSGNAQILAFSAKTPEELRTALSGIDPQSSWNALRRKAARLRKQFDVTHTHRLLLVVEHERTDVAKVLQKAQTMLEKQAGTSSWSTPDGIFYGSGSGDGSLGVIFPGQGAQYVGMLRDLACQFPQFQTILDTANQVFAHNQTPAASQRLSDLIYPMPKFTDEDRQNDAAALQSTQIAQPAIGAVSLGLIKILEDFGIQPDAVAGHSYGELVALCAAGVLDIESFFAMSKLRGQLMGQKSGDKGSMLAVQADETLINQVVKEESIDLVIANKNSPQQTVLSGATSEVERAAAIFKSRGTRCKQLHVAAAFHSVFVSDASGAFLDGLQQVELQSPRIPVYADSTAEQYPDDVVQIRELLAGQLANPVEFVKLIEHMYATGVRTFLEVGPSAQMNGLISAILKDQPVQVISVDSSAGKRAGETDLARTLSQLAAAGYAAKLSTWDEKASSEEEEPATSKKRKLSVQISGANSFKPKPPKPPLESLVSASSTRTATPPQPSASPAPKPAPPKQQPHPVPQPANPAAPVAQQPSAPPRPAPAPVPAASPSPAPTPPRPAKAPVSPQGKGLPSSPAPQIPHAVSGNVDLAEALRMTQENLRALQQFQQQTANLHQQFLEGQETTRQTFDRLFSQQQGLLFGAVSQGTEPSRPSPEPPRTRVSEPAVGNFSASIPAQAPSRVEPAQPVFTPEPSAAPIPEPVAAPVPSPAPVEQKPAPVPVPAASNGHGKIQQVLLSVVAEKTGYPEDMLDLDMGLDADLGIDSIKRVEILSALQEQLPEMPEISSDQLGTIQTLRQIVEAFGASAPAPKAASSASPHSAPPAAATDQIEASLLRTVAEKTGYPEDMLDLDMGLDADLGIDSIKRVEILSALQDQLPQVPDISSDQLGAIQTLRQIVDALAAVTPGTEQAVPPAAAAQDTSQIETTLLEVVSEKTGYPQDMLDLDMGLDADLGIDSIKRVEILSALQHQLPGAPEINSDQIGQIQNLRQIVDFLSVSTITPPHHTAPASPEQSEDSGALDTNQVQTVLLQVVSEKTGYPQDMLDLDMGLDADLGIDSIKRVEILSALQNQLPGAPEINSDQIGQIQNLRQIVDFLSVSVVSPSYSRTPAVAAHPPKTSGVDTNQVTSALLQVVAEKTGYPEDMLDLDMGLDADLGIDSIKRVEILSALQHQLPEAPEINSDQIGQIQNLRQIVDFLTSIAEKQPGTENSGKQQSSKAISENATASSEEPDNLLERSVVRLEEIAAPDTRPVVSLPPDSLIWIIDDGTALSETLETSLQQQGFQVQRMSMDQATSAQLPETLGGLVLLAPPAEDLPESFLKEAFTVAQQAGKALKAGNSVFLTVSRLDGMFGFSESPSSFNPLSGGLAGLAKTAGREWTEVQCKALDAAPAYDDVTAIADAILDEMFRIGPAEVGLTANGRMTLDLEQTSLPAHGEEPGLNSDDVVVVTGGARGVTAECALALARASQPTLILLGRSPAPAEDPEWLSGLTTESEIKKAILAHAGRKMSPKEVGQEYKRLLANREIQTNLARMNAAGSEVVYRSMDVRDAAAVQRLLTELQEQYGTITGFIHGAGVLADKRIEDKTAEQFDRVYGTKVEGGLNVLQALAANPLKMLVFFSSTTARLGRVGQVDYAMANEVLNKLAQQQARLHPQCRVLAMNWGPWAGGMVTPALENVFAREGIGLIPLQAGAQYLVRELAHAPSESRFPVEIVLLGKHGNPQKPEGKASQAASLPTSQEAKSAPGAPLTLAFERTLTIDEYPFLKSHVINGRAVLPMAMTIEWLGHAALHNNPGLVLHGFNEFRIFKGVTLQQGDAYPIQVFVGDAQKQKKNFLVPVEMHGRNADGSTVLHSRAEFLLTTRIPAGERQITRLAPAAYQPKGDMYQSLLFHGPDFHGIQTVEGCSSEGIIATASAAPNPSTWIKQPLRNHWLTDPLLLDSSFQMMILWSFAQYQAGSLPTYIKRYRQFQSKFSSAGGRILAQISKSDPRHALATIEFLAPDGQLMARMEQFECAIDPSLQQAFRQNTL